MTRVNVSEVWTTTGSVSGVQMTLNIFLQEWGMRVVGEQRGEVHARQGGWLGRLLGPRLAPVGWLPARAVVRFGRGQQGVELRATVGEASSATSLSLKTEAKYRDHFARWMAALKARLGDSSERPRSTG